MTQPSTNRPVVFVIFGATGDLSRRKLLPSLFSLYQRDMVPKNLRILGLSREHHTHESFRNFVRELLPETKRELVNSFLERLHFQRGDFTSGQTYLALSEQLIAWENKEWHDCSDKIFYLAVPPNVYETIFRNLANSGLTIPCGGPLGWTRVVVEKPFGRDLQTAQELDRLLGLLFREEQIFRVDHYLAKETLQNILAFRFSNALFEPLWNNANIEKVTITFWEDIGVGERGAFYEDVGALRDVGQNHLLQMLALIAMSDPGKLSPGRIRAKRADVLTHVRPPSRDEIEAHFIRGQYDGYRSEAQVSTASETETYFRIRAFVDTERWRGVPFYLESGKRLQEAKAEIAVHFRECVTCMTGLNDQEHKNVLIFRIQPNEGISIVFWAKRPGFTFELEPRVLSFDYRDSGSPHLPEAYERVLYDCIRGDQTLFTSTEEVSAAWKFITPILEQWKTLLLQTYEQGSRGPQKIVISNP